MEVSPLDNTVDDEVSDGDDPGESIHGYEQNTPQPQSRSESVTVDLHVIAANFVSKMKAKSNVPLSSLQNIIECTSEMFSEIVGMLENETLRVMEETGVELEGEKVQHLKKIFKDSCSPFAGFESQYKQEKYFADKGTYIPPVSIPLGVAFNPKRDAATGGVRQSQTHDSFQYIPIKDVLRAVLNQDGVLDSIEQYRSATADDDLKDFKDGEFYKFYKCHPCLGHQDCVNILLYFDELETTNPLRGNGTHKLGMFYFIIKNFHPAYLSCLDNIFLLAVARSEDIKHYGIDAIVDHILPDLKSLELEGLTVQNGDDTSSTLKVRIALGQTTGDNLGLHTLFGFAESFTANFPCRYCSMHRDAAHTATREESELRRTRASYDEDVATNNVSETGIKRNCPLNTLSSFHVVDNYVFDIMHDLLEGVCLIEVKLVLKSWIDQGRITLDTINTRLTSFDYGFCEDKNKPNIITDNSLKKTMNATGQKAVQTAFLIRHLPILVGDIIPENDEHLELILRLLRCMDIIFSPQIAKGETDLLGQLIQDHHEHYLSIFPDKHLLPKHHHMLHYPSAIEAIGPLIRFSSLRFEAKHNYFKQISHICCNYKNICKTMALRHQLTLSDLCFKGKLLTQKPVKTGKGSFQKVSNFRPNADVITDETGALIDEELFVSSSAEFNGIEYRPGMMVAIDVDSDCGNVVFGEIKNVFIRDHFLVYLFVHEWETLWFDDHLHAYALKEHAESQTTCKTHSKIIFMSVVDLFHLFQIEQDYDCLFENGSQLTKLWDGFFGKRIITYASADEESVVALQLLPHILPPKPIKSSNVVHRPSNLEAANAFIRFKQATTNIAAFLDTVEGEVQPFILALGDRHKPTQSFVIVERNAVEQTSLLKAVDCCFKLFFVLDIAYPASCHIVWEFLQDLVYQVPVRKGQTAISKNVTSLRNYFNVAK
ncbi:uncharacterized protein LOC135493501 [Lineus longissimus]|uniref:uncharacterized protein LOC135493501 n=1 Tax=Lineus longissimus TaxID=88925 RepID=UPI00315CA7F9